MAKGGARRAPAPDEPGRALRVLTDAEGAEQPEALAAQTSSGFSSTIARSSLEGLNTGTARGGTSTGSPVRGLRARRLLRSRTLKVPKPRISMF